MKTLWIRPVTLDKIGGWISSVWYPGILCPSATYTLYVHGIPKTDSVLHLFHVIHMNVTLSRLGMASVIWNCCSYGLYTVLVILCYGQCLKWLSIQIVGVGFKPELGPEFPMDIFLTVYSILINAFIKFITNCIQIPSCMHLQMAEMWMPSQMAKMFRLSRWLGACHISAQCKLCCPLCGPGVIQFHNFNHLIWRIVLATPGGVYTTIPECLHACCLVPTPQLPNCHFSIRYQLQLIFICQMPSLCSCLLTMNLHI